MKKLIRSPITWIILSVLALAVVLYFCGFRITYAPDLENSWDAISAFAGWAGVFASFVAVLVAVQIPKRIADEQNKIALFEKRHTFYYTFCRCISFCEGLDTVQSKDGVRWMFYTMLSNEPADCSLEEINMRITPLELRLVSIMDQGQFLFDFETDLYLAPLLNGIINILHAKTPEEFSRCRESLKVSGQTAKEELTPKLEAILKLATKN